MGDNIAGAVIHRHKIKQTKIDERIDIKFDKEPVGKNVPKPSILPGGIKKWSFG